MKLPIKLLLFIAGCFAMYLFDYWHEKRQFKAGFENGSAHEEVGRLFFSQLQFKHNQESSACGTSYIDAAIELSTHHLSEAETAVSKATLTSAVSKHVVAYKEQMRGLVVISSDHEKTFLGTSEGINVRVYRHRNLSCTFSLGTSADVVVDEILRQVFNSLPARMAGGPISE